MVSGGDLRPGVPGSLPARVISFIVECPLGKAPFPSLVLVDYPGSMNK